jgi:hypothetical protein
MNRACGHTPDGRGSWLLNRSQAHLEVQSRTIVTT